MNPLRRFARQINELRVSARFVGLAGVAGHHVRVHVNRINRVADGDFVFVAEDVEDVARVAFRAVADKNLVVGHVAAAVAEIILGDGGAQPFVALFRAVAFERFAHGHFVHGLVHGGDGGGRQRFGHVADAAADEALGGFGIRFAKNLHAPADFREKVAGFQFEIIVVEICHI